MKGVKRKVSRKAEIQTKLAILGIEVPNITERSGPMTLEERKEFWTQLMINGENDNVKLKASELLGKAEADFTENVNHQGRVDGVLVVQNMNLKGLKDAIRKQIE